MATFDGDFGLKVIRKMMENGGRYEDDPPTYTIHYYWNQIFKVHNFHVAYSQEEYEAMCDSPAVGLAAVLWHSWPPVDHQISPLGKAVLAGETPWEGKTQEEFFKWLQDHPWPISPNKL
jgi:hypothetical protein